MLNPWGTAHEPLNKRRIPARRARRAVVAAHPLRRVGAVLAWVRGTNSAAGHPVTAVVLPKRSAKGVRVAEADLRSLRIQRQTTCPEWNYTIKPGWTID